MTEPKRCCEKCRCSCDHCLFGCVVARNGCCHTPVSEPSLQGKIEAIVRYHQNTGLTDRENASNAAKAILALVEKPTPTPPPTKEWQDELRAATVVNNILDSRVTPPPTEWEERFDKKWEYSEFHWEEEPFGIREDKIKDFIRTLLAEQKARMVEVVEAEMAEWSEDKTGALAACRHIIKALSK